MITFSGNAINIGFLHPDVLNTGVYIYLQQQFWFLNQLLQLFLILHLSDRVMCAGYIIMMQHWKLCTSFSLSSNYNKMCFYHFVEYLFICNGTLTLFYFLRPIISKLVVAMVKYSWLNLEIQLFASFSLALKFCLAIGQTKLQLKY